MDCFWAHAPGATQQIRQRQTDVAIRLSFGTIAPVLQIVCKLELGILRMENSKKLLFASTNIRERTKRKNND